MTKIMGNLMSKRMNKMKEILMDCLIVMLTENWKAKAKVKLIEYQIVLPNFLIAMLRISDGSVKGELSSDNDGESNGESDCATEGKTNGTLRSEVDRETESKSKGALDGANKNKNILICLPSARDSTDYVFCIFCN